MSDLLATYIAAVFAADIAGEDYLPALDHAEQQKRAHGSRSREYKAADKAAEQAWVVYIEKSKASYAAYAAYDRWAEERRASS